MEKAVEPTNPLINIRMTRVEEIIINIACKESVQATERMPAMYENNIAITVAIRTPLEKGNPPIC